MQGGQQNCLLLHGFNDGKFPDTGTHLLEALRGRVKVTVTRLPAPLLQEISFALLPTSVRGMPSSPEIGQTPAFCSHRSIISVAQIKTYSSAWKSFSNRCGQKNYRNQPRNNRAV